MFIAEIRKNLQQVMDLCHFYIEQILGSQIAVGRFISQAHNGFDGFIDQCGIAKMVVVEFYVGSFD